ncbi:MAG: ribosome maturation factor RimP [Desulfobacterales bacterium]
MKSKRHKLKAKQKDNRNRKSGSKNEKAIIKQIESLVESLCDSEGLELVHIEYQREAGGRVLRLYIDRPAGVSIDDCVNVSRQLNDLLDVNLDDLGPYTLEVTSPGPERPLSKLKDYKRFKGRKAKIKTRQPIHAQKNFTGTIIGTSAEQIKLSCNEKTVVIPFGQIAKARLVGADGEI